MEIEAEIMVQNIASELGAGVKWVDDSFVMEERVHNPEEDVESEDEVDYEVVDGITGPNMLYGPHAHKHGTQVTMSDERLKGKKLQRLMKQGEFGDCYLISVLMCKAVMMHGLGDPNEIICAHNVDKGVFACRFWWHGRWQITLVDDAVLCRTSSKRAGKVYPIGAEVTDGVSIFLPIVEKAYGKVHRYLANAWGGFSRYAAVDVDGGLSLSCKLVPLDEALLTPVVLRMRTKDEQGGGVMFIAFSLASDAKAGEGGDVTVSLLPSACAHADNRLMGSGKYFVGEGLPRGVSDVAAQDRESGRLPSIVCPLTGDVMKDPVSDKEGNSYEREAILTWLERSTESPITRNSLSPNDLTENRALRNVISEAMEAPAASQPHAGEHLGGRLNMRLESVLMLMQRKTVLRTLTQLQGWKSCEYTDDAVSILIEDVFHGVRASQISPEQFEGFTGGLLYKEDLLTGTIDTTGALLRWWRGGDHPGRVWSARYAMWIPVDAFLHLSGKKAVRRLQKYLESVVGILEEVHSRLGPP